MGVAAEDPPMPPPDDGAGAGGAAALMVGTPPEARGVVRDAGGLPSVAPLRLPMLVVATGEGVEKPVLVPD